MKIVHICWGTDTNNGAANIARLIMDEQRTAGDEPVLVKRPTWAQLRAADQVWCHCGWYWIFWLVAAYRRFLHRPSKSSFPRPMPFAWLHWLPECCYDPVRLRFHGWKKTLVGPIERWALRQCDEIVATCAAEARWVRHYLHLEAETPSGCRCLSPTPRIVVSEIKRFFCLQPKPASATMTSPCSRVDEARALHVLYLGRPHPLKGVKYLELAVEEANRAAKALRPDGAACEAVELCRASTAKGEELERLWAWCDLLCLPTLSDNFGLVIAEALARGKRVLTTDGAPAWDPCERAQGVEEPWRDRLIYLKGYRNGSDALRVNLLSAVLKRCTHT